MTHHLEKPAAAKPVNLKISMSDELYAEIKAYKEKYKISLSTVARDIMKRELSKLNAAKPEAFKK